MLGKFWKKLGGKAEPAAEASPPPPQEQPAPSEPPRLVPVRSFPWAGEPDGITCNFAVGDLINNLPARLTVDSRVHAETLLTAIGAIAGFAAQRALIASIEETNDEARWAQLHMVRSKDGDTYLFGDLLNDTLFPTSDAEADLKLWPLVAGAGIAAGLDPAAVPKPERMFQHVSAVLGGEREGFTSLADVQPQLPAGQVLKLVWPLALMCFNGELSAKAVRSGMPPVAPRWRPVIAAQAAGKFIRDVHAVLAPDKAIIIVMEAAIYASKLSQTAIEEPAAS